MGVGEGRRVLLENPVIYREKARPGDMIIIRHVVEQPLMHLQSPIFIVYQSIRPEAIIDDGDVIAKICQQRITEFSIEDVKASYME